jgi:hypothetical protein
MWERPPIIPLIVDSIRHRVGVARRASGHPGQLGSALIEDPASPASSRRRHDVSSQVLVRQPRNPARPPGGQIRGLSQETETLQTVQSERYGGPRHLKIAGEDTHRLRLRMAYIITAEQNSNLPRCKAYEPLARHKTNQIRQEFGVDPPPVETQHAARVGSRSAWAHRLLSRSIRLARLWPIRLMASRRLLTSSAAS